MLTLHVLSLVEKNLIKYVFLSKFSCFTHSIIQLTKAVIFCLRNMCANSTSYEFMIDHELVKGGINLNYTILSEDPNYRILETLTNMFF